MTFGHSLSSSTVAQNGHDQTQLVPSNFEKQKAKKKMKKMFSYTHSLCKPDVCEIK